MIKVMVYLRRSPCVAHLCVSVCLVGDGGDQAGRVGELRPFGGSEVRDLINARETRSYDSKKHRSLKYIGTRGLRHYYVRRTAVEIRLMQHMGTLRDPPPPAP